MKTNKKGFTLIELLAVVIILIIIILIAVMRVNKTTKQTSNKTMVKNSITYINAVEDLLSVESLKSNDLKDGVFNTSQLEAYGFKLSGTLPDKAIVFTLNYEITSACFEFGKYKVEYNGSNYSEPVKGKCSGSTQNTYVYDFDVDTSFQEFTAPLNGTYKLEVWGAQGGSSGEYTGGYGGYAVGYISLEKDDVLYINVGGKGLEGSSVYPYNGGGRGSNNKGSSGGGATSISLTPEIIRYNDLENLLIVAGGGGGSVHWEKNWTSGDGGHGGGYIGGDGTTTGWAVAPGRGGTQTEGGASALNRDNNVSSFPGDFGIGGCYTTTANQAPGGGGGLYGGGGAYLSGAGGGSGYIDTVRLTNAEMYCYNCTESSETATKTTSVSCSKEDAESKCAKKLDGHARISLVM